MVNNSASEIRSTLGEPVVVVDEGLQPILFCSAKGTLLCQAQLPLPAYGNRQRMTHASRLSFAKSHDGGRSWEEFVSREKQDDVNIEGGIVQLADGGIMALETYVVPGESEGYGVGEVWTSADNLATLEGPREVNFELPRVNFNASTDDGGHPHRAARLHRSLLEHPNGDLLTTMYTWFHEDRAPSAYTPSMMKTRALLIRSKDRGETWRLQSTIAADDGVGSEGFTEPVLVRVSGGALEGRLICIMRTGRDLYEAHSDDDGDTWSIYRPVEIPDIDIRRTKDWEDKFVDSDGKPIEAKNPSLIGAFVDPDLIEMENGILVCAFGVRIPEKMCWTDPSYRLNGNFLAFSLDQGVTWSHVLPITSGVMTTHYMAVREVRPGELCVLYDLGAWGKPGRCIYSVNVTVG